MTQARAGLIIASLAILVLFYFSASYLLAFIVDILKNSAIIPGAESYEKEAYIGSLRSIPQVIGILLSAIWGVLADKVGRRKMIAVMTALMSAGLIAVYVSSTYQMLLAAFIVFGVGSTGIAPIVYAFVADVLAPERRGVGYAAYYASSVLGFIGAYVFYAIVKQWQLAYMSLGVLIFIAGVMLLSISHGVRIGGAEKAPIVEFRVRDALSSLRKATVIATLVMIVFWTIPWGMLTTFAVDYMMVKWGVSKTSASLILLASVLSIAVGHVAGGILSDKMARRRGPSGRILVSIAGILVGMPAMLSMIMYPYPCGSDSMSALTGPLLLAVSGMMFTTLAYPNITVVLSDVVKAEHRGTVFSVYNILNTLGWAIGPILYPMLAYTYMPPDVRTSDLPRLIMVYDNASMKYVNSCTLPGVEAVKNAYMYSASTIVLLWVASLIMWLVIRRTYKGDRVYT
ncbi:MFS transporter [Desulfurococcus mucosus]|uniref:MFS transporter n=1 Tax=Desulfurococcus mucosus TaxID=2275 RepID=UPI00064E3C9D|nr:MFS transporter [Desulfurococcus mucosus]